MNTLTHWTTFFLFLGTLHAQTEHEQAIDTDMVKLNHLITYAADNYPLDEPIQLTLLLEVPHDNFTKDNQFFIEQGLQLLITRLDKGDQISLVVYGGKNKILRSYSDPTTFDVNEALEEYLRVSSEKSRVADGMDLAYELASQHYQKEVNNKVLIIRNNQRKLQTATRGSSTTKELQAADTKKGTKPGAQHKVANQTTLGGAIALTALTLLPDIIEIIKN